MSDAQALGRAKGVAQGQAALASRIRTPVHRADPAGSKNRAHTLREGFQVARRPRDICSRPVGLLAAVDAALGHTGADSS